MKQDWKRELQPCAAAVKPFPVNDLGEVRPWLQKQAADHHLPWLLAHADDGVIWGRLDGGRLVTSFEAAAGDGGALGVCPELRTVTLQQARLFGPAAELLLWRDGGGRWQARLIRDCAADEATWAEGF